MVLVTKKDGTTRFCVDYRKLNDATKKDAYPLPRIDDTLNALRGSTYFSTLDLYSDYWQVEMDQQDMDKTAFVTHQVQIYSYAIRTLQCSCHLRTANGAGPERSQLESLPHLFGRHHRIWGRVLFRDGPPEDGVETNSGGELEAETD